jgi:hypothetical protein
MRHRGEYLLVDQELWCYNESSAAKEYAYRLLADKLCVGSLWCELHLRSVENGSERSPIEKAKYASILLRFHLVFLSKGGAQSQ